MIIDAIELRKRFESLAEDASLTVHRHFPLGDEGVRYDVAPRFAVSGNEESRRRRFEDVSDEAGKLLSPKMVYPPRNYWFGALFDRGCHRIDRMEEDARLGHACLPDAAHVSLNLLSSCVEEGWIPRSSIAAAAVRLRQLLGATVDAGDLPAHPDDSDLSDELAEARDVLIHAFNEFATDAKELPTRLAHVWTPTIGEEVVNMIAAAKSITNRMRHAKAYGLTHPIWTSSNASNDQKQEWIADERLLWSMANRLEALDLATPDAHPRSPDRSEEANHSPDFTTANWFGTRYKFTKGNQAQSVRVLWEAWEAGGHSLTQETIRARIESSAERFELSKVFRSKRKGEKGYLKHPAWGTMIQQDTKGSYRLVRPQID